MTKNIMIVGVGGQGSLLASKILGAYVMDKGFDVKVSEVHGMAQRGGSVVTYVRYGEQVASPIIEDGECDVIIAFEQLEAIRYLSALKKDGIIIYNTQKISPMPVIMGAVDYPSDIKEKISGLVKNSYAIDALSLAKQAGSSKAVNVVLIGLFAAKSGIDKEDMIKALKKSVPEKFLELNLKAFELGYNT